MIKSIIKTSDFISVTLDDGTVLVTSDSSSEMFHQIRELDGDDDAIIRLMCPEEDDLTGVKVVSKDVADAYNGVGDFASEHIEFKNGRAYLPEISDLTLPQEFVEKFIAAEKAGDEELVQTYLNFWTLVSMNPNSEVRNNLFWFINKWGIKLTKSGLLITYRNADFKHDGKFTLSEVKRITQDYLRIKSWKKSPKNYYYNDCGELLTYSNQPDGSVFNKDLATLYEEATAQENTTSFTDHHSHTFTIKIGSKVSMPREKCDPDVNCSCTAGLNM